jgi:hypothetical protein
MSADFGGQRVEGLVTRIREYESYFAQEAAKEKKPDHQGTTAYINLVKLVCSLKEAEAHKSGDPEERAREARRIFKEQYGVEL